MLHRTGRLRTRHAHAFTLVELIVVILIVGILAAVGVLSYGHITESAKQKAAQAGLRTVTNSVLAGVALNPGTDFSRDLVTSTIAEATGTTIIDGIGAASTTVGFHDEHPGERQYSVAFDGTDPDVRGPRAALLSTGGGETYAQLLTLSGSGATGVVAADVTPSDVLADPSLIAPLGTDPRHPGDTPEPPSPPAQPVTGVTGNVTPDALTILWAGSAQSYTVRATGSDGSTLTCSSTTTTCTLPSPAAGVTYQVVVTAEYADGRATAAAPVTVLPAPTAPTLSADLDGAEQYTATWTATDGATNYLFEARVDGGPWERTRPTETRVSAPIAPGTSVEVRVAAVTSNAVSNWSAPVTLTRALSSPVVSASAGGDYSAKFTWPAVPGADQYRVDHSVDGGTWVTGTPQSALTATLPAGNHSTISVRVHALKDSQTSAPGTAAHTTQAYARLPMASPWSQYGTAYGAPRATRTAEGVVALAGMVKTSAATSGTDIATLPAGYRPQERLLHLQSASGGTVQRIDIRNDGTIHLVGDVPADTWISLSGITFVEAGSSLARTPMRLDNGWTNYAALYGDAHTVTDKYGRVHVQAMITGTTTGRQTVAWLGAGTTGSQYDDFISGATIQGPIDLIYKAGFTTNTATKGWMSLNGLFYASGKGTFTPVTPLAGWANTANRTPFSVTKAADGLVTVRGFIRGGTVTSGTLIGQLPAGMRPEFRESFDVSNNGGFTRVEVQPDGNITINGSTSNAQLVLDAITFRSATR